jgi:hypothetical protein
MKCKECPLVLPCLGGTLLHSKDRTASLCYRCRRLELVHAKAGPGPNEPADTVEFYRQFHGVLPYDGTLTYLICEKRSYADIVDRVRNTAEGKGIATSTVGDPGDHMSSLAEPITMNVVDPVGGTVLRMQVCNRCNCEERRHGAFSAYRIVNLDDELAFKRARDSGAMEALVHPWGIKGKDGREV